MIKIFSSFIWKKKPIVVKGSLERFRDFLFVEDLVEALIKSYDCENAYNQVYVLSSGKKVLLGELIPQIIRASGNSQDYPVIISDGTKGDTHGFHADTSKIRRDLNWEPKHDLGTGLKKVFEWIGKVPHVDDLSPYHPLNLN